MCASQDESFRQPFTFNVGIQSIHAYDLCAGRPTKRLCIHVTVLVVMKQKYRKWKKKKCAKNFAKIDKQSIFVP